MKKNQIPVTTVISVLNEESSIVHLLNGLEEQTVDPSEVIIVDGGSTDSTLRLLHEYQKQNLNLKILSLTKANRSQARNAGIERAKTEVIVVTDAGCVPKPNWLEKITQPFFDAPKTEVVAGFYDPDPQNQFEEIVANVTSIRPWNFDQETFLPSSRSVAFTKTIWRKVGKYSEKLSHNEDLPFAESLKKSSKHWKVVKDAQVIWRQPTSISELMSKLQRYALGDLESGHERHSQKIRAAVWRIAALFAFAFPLFFMQWIWAWLIGIGFFCLYIFGTWIKHRRALRNPSYFFLAPVIQLAVDVALVQGWIEYYLARASKSPFSQST